MVNRHTYSPSHLRNLFRSANLATCQGKQFPHFLDARDTGKREQRLLLGLQPERYEKQFHLKDSIEVSSSILCFCGIPQMLG